MIIDQADALMPAVGMLLGLAMGHLCRLDAPKVVALGFETGIQNAPLAIGVVVLSFADQPPILFFSMQLVAIVYGMLAAAEASVLCAALRWVTRASRQSKPTAEAAAAKAISVQPTGGTPAAPSP